jgi:hypothetical protein
LSSVEKEKAKVGNFNETDTDIYGLLFTSEKDERINIPVHESTVWVEKIKFFPSWVFPSLTTFVIVINEQ